MNWKIEDANLAPPIALSGRGHSLTNYTNSLIEFVLLRSITPRIHTRRFVQFVKDVPKVLKMFDL